MVLLMAYYYEVIPRSIRLRAITVSHYWIHKHQSLYQSRVLGKSDRVRPNHKKILGEPHLWNEVQIYQVKYYLTNLTISWSSRNYPRNVR